MGTRIEWEKEKIKGHRQGYRGRKRESGTETMIKGDRDNDKGGEGED